MTDSVGTAGDESARNADYERLAWRLRAAGGRVQISRFWTRQWRHAFGWPASGDALARA